MKHRRNLLAFLVLFLAGLVFLGMTYGNREEEMPEPQPNPNDPYYAEHFQPVIKKRDSLRGTVSFQPEESVDSIGKFYYNDERIFLNETGKGVHIYDNSNPKQPQYIGFITVPGSQDIAVRKDILYVDSYTDLLAIDIAEPQNPRELHRIPNEFGQLVPEELGFIPEAHKQNLQDEEIIVAWKEN